MKKKHTHTRIVEKTEKPLDFIHASAQKLYTQKTKPYLQNDTTNISDKPKIENKNDRQQSQRMGHVRLGPAHLKSPERRFQIQ